MLHLLALPRRYRDTQRSVTERLVGQPIGTSLAGKTVGVLGTGGIGIAVIRRLKAFGVRPLAIGRRAFADYPDLADLLTQRDYYSTDGLTTALTRSHALVVTSITPHIGGVTAEAYTATAQTFAANVRRLHAGEPLAHLVKEPRTPH